MNNLQLEPEFVRLVQSIYGDANLDGRVIKQVYQTWKTNPNFLINAYFQKQGKPNPTTPIQMAPPRLQTAPTAKPTQINIRVPQKEIARDDLSGIGSFNDAFRIARQRELSQFRWKSTKANPSGLFQVELATQKPAPKASEKSQASKTSTSEQSTSNNTSRNTMSKAYYKSMIDKGFTWNSKKGMWNNPKKPNNTPAQTQTPTVQQPAPTSREWRWTDGLFGKGVKWSWNPRDGVSLSTSLFQQGGKLEDLQKEFVAYLIQISGSQSEQDLNDFIQSLGEEGLKQQYQQFMQTMQNGTPSAKNGAKLNYIRSLRGVCPEGYELGYFKEGGQICPKCMKKREKMGAVPFKPIQGEKGTKVVQDFKKDLKNKKDKISISKKAPEKKEQGGTLNISEDLLELFKCGGKSKKMKKKENGGLVKKNSRIPIKEKFIDKDKCGKKMKKK